MLVVFLSLHYPLPLGNFSEITFDNKSGYELVSTVSIRKMFPSISTGNCDGNSGSREKHLGFNSAFSFLSFHAIYHS